MINDVTTAYADNQGQFYVAVTTTKPAGGASSSENVAVPATATAAAGTAPSLTVAAGQTVTWTAAGSVADELSGSTSYYSAGPAGVAGSAGTCTSCTCPAAPFLGLICVFTPAGSVTTCGPCNASHGSPMSVGGSVLTSRCQIYSATCVDIGTGTSGTFTDSTGATFAWSDTGDPAPASITTAADVDIAVPGTAATCVSGANYISITRTA